MFWLRFITALAVAVFCLTANDAIAPGNVPKIWDRHELEQMDVPVSPHAYSQTAVSPDYYYRIPVAPFTRAIRCTLRAARPLVTWKS